MKPILYITIGIANDEITKPAVKKYIQSRTVDDGSSLSSQKQLKPKNGIGLKRYNNATEPISQLPSSRQAVTKAVIPTTNANDSKINRFVSLILTTSRASTAEQRLPNLSFEWLRLCARV